MNRLLTILALVALVLPSASAAVAWDLAAADSTNATLPTISTVAAEDYIMITVGSRPVVLQLINTAAWGHSLTAAGTKFPVPAATAQKLRFTKSTRLYVQRTTADGVLSAMVLEH